LAGALNEGLRRKPLIFSDRKAWSRAEGRRSKVRPVGAALKARGRFLQPDHSVLAFGAATIEICL